MTYSITIDTGGTFTDLVLADERTLRGLHKALTTPDDPYAGILAALGQAARAEGLDVAALLERTDTVVYATTHASNAILNLAQPYPDPYVPRSLSFELPERIASDGSVVQPLDEAATLRVIDRLRALRVEAVGVCLLWSIANPSHEQRVGELLASALPGIPVSLSCELNPNIREYRRASAAVIDASLKPLMRAHLQSIDQRLRALGFRGEPLMVTHMSGGVLGFGEMCEHPLHCVDSGPALAPVAGLVYARAEAEVAASGVVGTSGGEMYATIGERERRDVLVVDAGGTSVDISPTRDGRVVYSREKWLGPRWIGHMTGLPAVETKSIGAGGGSIARVDRDGLLCVGPESAGASPGPACYDRGGARATVTDAALLLGYLDPAYFLGGRMRLVPDLAREAIEGDVAKPLGLPIEAAATAVMAVFSESLRSFLSEMTILQGLDPRQCVLVAGGGAAGLNIVCVARELRIDRIVIPTLAAGLSAVGGQFADLFSSFTRSVQTTTANLDAGAIARALDELEATVEDFFDRVSQRGTQRRELVCEARYANQLWEIDVPLPWGWRGCDESERVELSRRFDRLHRALFSVEQPGEILEL
ncbi:MAG: hydantoinase/oxoprolinase family protein, partial [Deltaproteobacteria bacterium]|nr:hydantoinase/oxoprolinase family protein [Deltaproteobacteria bacterium]